MHSWRQEDGSNGNRGGRPTVTYYDIRFPQLGRATSKSALTTTMISGSNSAGELIPPHFQFQTAAQTNEAEAVRVLAACAMSQEEFDQLVANRHSLIVDPPSSSTSEAAPANELIVDSPPNSDAPVDTPPTGEDKG